MNKTKLNKIFETELKPYCETHFNYDDEINNEDLIKYITGQEEHYLSDEQYNDLFHYANEQINELIYSLEEQHKFNEKDKEYLTELCLDNWNFNEEQLLNNSNILLRIELHGNEDMIHNEYYKQSEIFNALWKLLKENKALTKKELVNNIQNCTCDYSLPIFPIQLNGKEDIKRFKEDYKKGFLTIKAGTFLYFFNSFIGSGTLAESELKKDIKLNVNKWFGKSEYNKVYVFDDSTNGKYGYSFNSVYMPTREAYNTY